MRDALIRFAFANEQQDISKFRNDRPGPRGLAMLTWSPKRTSIGRRSVKSWPLHCFPTWIVEANSWQLCRTFRRDTGILST